MGGLRVGLTVSAIDEGDERCHRVHMVMDNLP